MKNLSIMLFSVLAFLVIFPTLAQSQCYVMGEEVPCDDFPTGLLMGIGWLFLVVIILGIITFVLWLWMLIDCAQREFKDKTLWILILLLTGIIGAILYYFIVKRKNL